jgi:hypothetical protein
MPFATQPTITTFATIAVPGTSVSPDQPIPDNCHTVVVKNAHATATAYWKQEAPGSDLTADDDASAVFPLTGDTLPLGTIAQRGSMDPATVPAIGLSYDSTVAQTLKITYFCTFNAAVY